MDCTHFCQSIKSPYLPLRGNVSQHSKKKRVLCWSISILLVYASMYIVDPGVWEFFNNTWHTVKEWSAKLSKQIKVTKS